MSSAPRSLGLASDLVITSFDGVVDERDDYWVLRTPSNPKYFYGNCLFFRDPPDEENVLPDGPRSWERIFDREFGRTAYGGRLMAWDRTAGEHGASGALLARGYTNDDGFALIGTSVVRPPRFRPDIEVRPVRGEAEWAEAEALCRGAFADHAHGDSAGQLEFVTLQFRRYRQWSEAGRGTYYGAFLAGEMAGAAGLFGRDGLFRYQLVGTRRELRNQGVAATLVYGAGHHALTEMSAKTLVILAAVDYHAWRVYESAGLAPLERIPGVRVRGL